MYYNITFWNKQRFSLNSIWLISDISLVLLLLRCRSMGDPRKTQHRSHASYRKRVTIAKKGYRYWKIVLFLSNRCCTWLFVSDWIHFFIARYSYFSGSFFLQNLLFFCQIILLLLQETYSSQPTTDRHHH